MNEVGTAWRINPGLVVHLPERFKNVVVERECGRWVRTHNLDVLDHPDALRFVVANRSENNVQRDSKVNFITHIYKC